MLKTLKTVFSINASSTVNKFLYYFRRLPLIGKFLPELLYKDAALKKIFLIIAGVLRILNQFLFKALYVGAMCVLPVVLLYENLPVSGQWPAFVHLFFFLSFVAGAIQFPVIFDSDPEKYTCIRLMGIPARQYVLTMIAYKYLRTAVAFFPSLMIAAAVFQAPLWQGLVLTVIFVLWRIACEAFHAFLYAKAKVVLCRKYPIVWAVILASLAAAYLPVFFHTPLRIDAFLLGGFFPLVFAVSLAALAVSYLLNFKDYRGAVNAAFRLDRFQVDPEKAAGESRFADVKIRENEFSQSSLQSGKYSAQKGYRYLNSIFFERHKRLLWRPVAIRLLIIGAVLAVGIISAFIFPQEMRQLGGNISRLLPVFVFIMYFVSIGERVCRAMFYNCDISLLRYGYYRRREAVLENFRIRLQKIAGLNFITSAAICTALFIFVLITGGRWPVEEMIPFMLSLLCLSLFFSVHHLFLYYVFQPYTTELGMKNPFFSIINLAVYFACYLCLQIDSPPKYFALIVLGATLLYSAVALLLVYHFSPRTFRVK